MLWTVVSARIRYVHCGLSGEDLASINTPKDQRKHLEPGYKNIYWPYSNTLCIIFSPSLTWRDVQYLIAYTANPNLTAASRSLIRNGAGLAVSRQYGFGVMDAEAMVTRARHWINVPPQIQDRVTDVFRWVIQTLLCCYQRVLYTHPQHRRNISNVTYSATINYTGSLQYLEHVIVKLSVSIPENTQKVVRGDIQIELTSPSGTLSILLWTRRNDNQTGEYFDWPFMSVMFWGEDPTGQWTLNIATRNITGVAAVSDVEFQFYGVFEVPEAVANIPDECHSDCRRGCAREGSNFCDSCVNLRNAYTLECINECPLCYIERSGYCYDHSLPTKKCISPLKNKMVVNTNFSCSEAGFTGCCTDGNCASAPSQASSCFCDALCYKYKDCCDDVNDIGCSNEQGILW